MFLNTFLCHITAGEEEGDALQHLRQTVIGLIEEAFSSADLTGISHLAPAAGCVLDAMVADGLLGQDDAWVYRSVMEYLVESGSLSIQEVDCSTVACRTMS